MMNDQTKQKIEAWVEEEMEGWDNQGENYREVLRRAIIFGLELGKEAGPEMAEDTFEGETRYSKGVILGFNEALTEKNAAIQEMIELVKKGV